MELDRIQAAIRNFSNALSFLPAWAVSDLVFLLTVAVGMSRIVLAGHSMGGWATAHVASHDHALAGAILISAADMGRFGLVKRSDAVTAMADDMESLSSMGVGRLFGPGASTRDIAQYIRDWFRETHGEEAFVATPAAAAEAWTGEERRAKPRRALSPRSARPARAAKKPRASKPRRAAGKARGATPRRKPARASSRSSRAGARSRSGTRAGARKRR